MNTNVNLDAPIAVLALLGTGFLIFVAGILLVQSLIVRKLRRAKLALLVVAGIVVLYGCAVLIFSLTSHSKLLARGEEKHFCELDCHLAYSIANVTQSPVANSQASSAVVTIKTRFDETTIASSRGNALLYPNSRSLTLSDDQDNSYSPVSVAGTSLATPLRPGESYTTDVTFNLPSGVKAQKLLIHEADWITRIVIGHENSPLHKKTEFQL
jgi:hypothetical protein